MSGIIFKGSFNEFRPLGHWMHEASCLGSDEEFFPNNNTSTMPAKAICVSCPVKERCLEYGLDEPAGIWGGASTDERRRLRRTKKIKPASEFRHAIQQHFESLYAKVDRWKNSDDPLCAMCYGPHLMLDCPEVA